MKGAISRRTGWRTTTATNADDGEKSPPGRQEARVRDALDPAVNRERTFIATSAVVFLTACALTIWMGHAMAMAGHDRMVMSETSTQGMTMPEASPMAARSFLGMWVVMMVAMMMPSLVPMLSRYRGVLLALGDRRHGRLTMLAGIGYFAVWTVLGAVAYAARSVITATPPRASIAGYRPLVTSLVLMIAGGVQLTRWKLRQLARCRDAPDCAPPLLRKRGSLGHGLQLGLHCMLCCSGFMMAMFAGGVMNLRVMGLVALGITIERVVRNPTGIARAAGLVLLAAGAVVLGRAVG
jgi:predicted metal-binding membrane protein